MNPSIQELRKCLATLVDRSHERLRTYKPAFEYITERGLTVDTIKGERLGYCDMKTAHEFISSLPEDVWDLPREYLIPRFAKRIIVPVTDDCGAVVAVATRAIVPPATEQERKIPKWWSTPFRKEMYVYGMDKARDACFRKNKAYLFEGYVDRMYLAQSGLENSVSPMGITLTPIQAGVIFRYCDRLCVCFDTDPAKNGREGGGQLGLKKLVGTYNCPGQFKSISAIVLPLKDDGTAYDPDEFVMEHGLEAFLALEKRVKRESSGQDASHFKNELLFRTISV
jgi:DNA primase